MNQYEIMFLFDPTFGTDWPAVEKEIDRLMQRAKAEIILTKRLEERKLAYEIEGRKRGLYVLTFFRAPSESISSLERDCRLSEMVLRVLILRVDGLTEERMRNATLAGVSQDSRPRGDDDRRERHPGRSEDYPDVPEHEMVGSSRDDTEGTES